MSPGFFNMKTKMATTEKLEESNEETCESVWPPHLSLHVSSTRGYLQLLVTPGLGFEPRPHWWEASAVTSAPSLLPNTCETVARPFGQGLRKRAIN